MRPMGRVPSNFVFGPVQFLQLAVILRGSLWGAYSASPNLLTGFKGEKKRGVRMGVDETGVEQ